MAQADFLLLLASMVPDSTATPEDRTRALGLALVRYSTDVPRVLVDDVVWPATGYTGPLPPEWTAASALESAEHPIGQQPPALVDVALYVDAGGALLTSALPLPVGAAVRVTYTAPHASAATVPARHEEAVAVYAAHLLCQQLATYYSAQRETAVGAEASNTDTRARNFASRAKDYRRAYYVGIGQIDPYAEGGQAAGGVVQAAAAVGNWPSRRRFGLGGGALR